MIQITYDQAMVYPQFDGSGNTWVLGTDGVPRLVSSGGVLSPVTIEDRLTNASILGMSLSPDDSRMALIVQRGPRRVLVLATVVARVGAFSLAGLRRVETVLSDVRAVAWSSSESIAALAAAGASTPEVYEVDVARATATSRGAPSDAVGIAASPGLPILVGTDFGRLFFLEGDQWVPGAFGTSPTYVH
jgi:hypothetical protein